jgi:hypothetical protein
MTLLPVWWCTKHDDGYDFIVPYIVTSVLNMVTLFKVEWHHTKYHDICTEHDEIAPSMMLLKQSWWCWVNHDEIAQWMMTLPHVSWYVYKDDDIATIMMTLLQVWWHCHNYDDIATSMMTLPQVWWHCHKYDVIATSMMTLLQVWHMWWFYFRYDVIVPRIVAFHDLPHVWDHCTRYDNTVSNVMNCNNFDKFAPSIMAQNQMWRLCNTWPIRNLVTVNTTLRVLLWVYH